MSDVTGLSRGDRNRNSKLASLRSLVPVSNATAAIDLADDKQMLVVTDRDSTVLARRTFRCRAWDLGAALDWAAAQAETAGFAGVTVSCEPTGHRWRVVGQLAADGGMPFVCVQGLLVSWARRTEDLTFDKTDEKDAVLIARLAAQLRCYLPEVTLDMTRPVRRVRPSSRARSGQDAGLAYAATPVSNMTQGSSPTVQASCPGSKTNTSPASMVASVPSSERTVICPDRQMPVCRVMHDSVPAIGLTSLDHCQPGSKVPLPNVKSPRVTTST